MECWVVPGASRTEIKGLHGGRLRIRVSAPPEGGRANREVLELIGERCGAPVELLSGHSSRHKRLLIVDTDPETVLEALLSDHSS